MKHANRLISLLLVLILCISVFPMTIFAATTRDNQLPPDIDTVSVLVTEPVDGAKPATPIVENGIAIIDTYQWSGAGKTLSETDTFQIGNKYRLILSIASASDANFQENSTVTINGKPATIQSVDGKFIGCTYDFTLSDANPYHLRWKGMTARWDAIPGATDYSLTLYKDDGVLTSISSLGKNEYDASNYILKNGVGAYQFQIRARINGVYRPINTFSPLFEYDGKVPFKDVDKSDYFYEPVSWAVEKNVSSGTSATAFEPDSYCTRAQAVTFLWRAKGSPAPTKTDNPFTDVKQSDYFYKAVLWAVEKGVTNGTGSTTFSPNDTCTRGQIVTFQWRSAGQTISGSSANPFKDVASSDYFYNAVLWAVEKNITNGTTSTTFSPNDFCTRGQIVTFLYRQLAN